MIIFPSPVTAVDSHELGVWLAIWQFREVDCEEGWKTRLDYREIVFRSIFLCPIEDQELIKADYGIDYPTFYHVDDSQ